MEQTTTTLSRRSRISSSSYSFQPSTDSSMSTSCTGDAARPPPASRSRSSGVCAMPEPRPPIVNDGRITTGRPRSATAACTSSIEWQTALRGTSPADGLHDLLELQPVLAALDRVDVGADQLDAVALQHAVLVQRDGGVQRGLPAQGGQQRVGALGGDHLLDELRGDRLDVGGVGELGVRHDRRRVGVDQRHAQALGAQHAAGLGAGVVELGGLADDDRAGADHQHVPEVVAAGHQRPFPGLLASMSSTNRSNRSAASCGPGRGLGVVLHAERRGVQQRQALDAAVVRAGVGDLRGAERGVEPLPRLALDGEPVVLRGDRHLAGGVLDHRDVDAPVAVAQLVGAPAQRAGRGSGCRSRCRTAGSGARAPGGSARRGRPRSPGRPGRWPGRTRPGPAPRSARSACPRAARGSRRRARRTSAGCST